MFLFILNFYIYDTIISEEHDINTRCVMCDNLF